MTSPEQKSPHSVERDNPDTDVIEVSAASPVFVDATGRRRRLLRRLTFAFGGLLMVYGGLISVSLAGGPVSSSSILPLPDRDEKTTAPQPTATPTPVATTPQAQPIIEALPRVVPATRHEAPRRSTPVATRPPTRPSPPKTAPSPSVSASKPVESTSSPAPSPSAGSTTATVTPQPDRPPAPKPPSLAASGDESGDGEIDLDDATPEPADSVAIQVAT